MPVGIYKRSEEHKKKISNALKGIKRSEETKRKMSLSKSITMKLLWQNPEYRKIMLKKLIARSIGRPKPKDSYCFPKGDNHPSKKLVNREKAKLRMLGENNPMYKIGEKHPNWQGGKSFEPYPLGWTRTFKEQIRYRDGYRCQLCGVPEMETGRKLYIHHKDYDKKNIEQENLISLCLKCHSKTNFNREYWIRNFIGHQKVREHYATII